ncbi:MAG: sigma-54-dependent Fis family transcriptional regulator [Kofleriaceae bacterium]|nr:sigma-54-dependent Fis family transcriptional regulator [Kofleriaceae bacterium]
MQGSSAQIRRHFVAESQGMKNALAAVEALSAVFSDGPESARPRAVLIEGEPGSGRELIARYLHLRSARAEREMVSIKAASASVTLFSCPLEGESEAPFRNAHGRTLLVRDVCEMRRRSQRKLAKALEPESGWDIRVLVTTDPGLESAVEAGMFHQPLLQMLSQTRIVIPPLRERIEDIVPLMGVFVSALCRDMGRRRLGLSSRASDMLQSYPWPGNVAEMKQVARRLVARAKGSLIEVEDLDKVLPVLARRVPAEDASFEDLVRTKLNELMRRVQGYPMHALHEEVMSLVEKPLLGAVLKHTGNNQLKASEILGLSRNTLRRKLVDYGIVASRANALRAKRSAKLGKRGLK